ncbi:hypothetical protein ENBRE01_0409 [Enteropsectra breve]|nr:hypothetical protein ENBRE01_0409 [Enteropsectra breve]
MLLKLNVPTKMTKAHLEKYFNKNTCLKHPTKPKKRHVPHYSNVLCKFFTGTGCQRGDECVFSHDMSQFQCPSLAEGRECTTAKCGYKHDRTAMPLDASNLGMEKSPAFISPFI